MLIVEHEAMPVAVRTRPFPGLAQMRMTGGQVLVAVFDDGRFTRGPQEHPGKGRETGKAAQQEDPNPGNAVASTG